MQCFWFLLNEQFFICINLSSSKQQIRRFKGIKLNLIENKMMRINQGKRNSLKQRAGLVILTLVQNSSWRSFALVSP